MKKFITLSLLCFLSLTTPVFASGNLSTAEVVLIQDGMQAVGQNRLSDALKAFRAARKINPQSAPALVGEAQVLTLQDAWDEALALLNRAIDIDPEFAIAYHNRGLLKFYQGNALEAHADLRKAIDLGETVEDDVLFQVWGAAFPGDAVEALNEHIEKNPEDGQAFVNRGIAHFYQEDYQSTLNDWEQAKKLGFEPNASMLAELEAQIKLAREE